MNIYERIGSDKGCYFIEGINLRKISLKSDTYDFYTRIYPIGKDGITPEWLTGKDYIDNFQYSSKVKAYVWKDERYTKGTETENIVDAVLAELEKRSNAAAQAEEQRIEAEKREILDDLYLYGM